jgi:PKD repeat protein
VPNRTQLCSTDTKTVPPPHGFRHGVDPVHLGIVFALVRAARTRAAPTFNFFHIRGLQVASSRTRWTCVGALIALTLGSGVHASAATIYVAAGGNLQTAINNARPGDTIVLAEGAEYVGNFILPLKAGDDWITIRSGAPDHLLPAAGVRIRPADAALLPRLRSPNGMAALRTVAGAHHWHIEYVEFKANKDGIGDLIQIGDGSSAQNTLEKVPHHFTLRHLYVHGHPVLGQKRCIALNGAHVTVADSHLSDCKAIGQDSQAINGWNGPGPFVIQNNYLEGAGENIMFGGSDPAILNLVPSDITIRHNLFSRPMAWRNPVLDTPQGPVAAAEPGGTLDAGVYTYRIVARGPVGQGFIGRSSASVDVAATVDAPGGAVRVRWQPVPGATEYRVYGRTAGALSAYWRVTAAEFVDIGAAGTPENVPTSIGTRYSVKNLFELKAARNLVIENNIFENHWLESQPGYSILFTVRSGGTCTWCVIENVRFEYNLVRNVAAGISMTGYDQAIRPTKQTNNILIRQNLFSGMTTSLGGNGWFLLIGDSPRDVVLEHNTIDSNGSTIVYAYGGTSTDPREVTGFQMIANAARHGSYGISAASSTYGNATLNGYFPGAVVTGNYLSGGLASRYPAGNLFAGTFADQFVAASTGNYTVREGSLLKRAAFDGTDIGVDHAALMTRLSGVEAGVEPGASVFVPPAADFSATCTYLACTFADASSAGSNPIAGWTWSLGEGTNLTGTASATHQYGVAGTYTVTLTVVDQQNVTASTTRTVSVEAPNVAPTAAFVPVCADLTCTFTDGSADSDGTIASRNWTFGAAGTSTSASPSFVFPGAGSYDVTLTVTDDDGATATATVPVQIVPLVHAGYVTGATTRWNSSNPAVHYWSATATVAVHGGDERPIAGATITAAWTGALSKTVTCVTNASGQCTFKSGTLSHLKTWVTLTVVGVSSPSNSYVVTSNHGLTANAAGTAVTFVKP